LIARPLDTLRYRLQLARFRATLAAQAALAALLERVLPAPASAASPKAALQAAPPLSASAFIASLNTHAALRLCLGSLERRGPRPPLPLWIVDNASTDGSVPFLEAYAAQRPNVQLLLHPEIRWHGAWIDAALERCDADLLFVLDSDLIFFGSSLIPRCIAYMRQHPDCLILQADPWSPGAHAAGPEAPLREPSLSTWFLCIRTSLRQVSDVSFLAVFPEQQQPRQGRPVMSDTGAKVIADLERQGRGNSVQVLPRRWRPLFHHIGSLSWLRWADDPQGRWVRYKKAQLRLLERRGKRLLPDLP
jgi:glycosyltransferase involved in cell wall biosynthesis